MDHSVLIERSSATERHNARTVPMRLSHFVVVRTTNNILLPVVLIVFGILPENYRKVKNLLRPTQF